jgi:hypothetical protein
VGLVQLIGNAIGDTTSLIREAVTGKVDQDKPADRSSTQPTVSDVADTSAGANQIRPTEKQARHVGVTPGTRSTAPTRRPADGPDVPVTKGKTPPTQPVYRGEIKTTSDGGGWLRDAKQAIEHSVRKFTDGQPIYVEQASFVLSGESIARGNADARYNRYLGDAVRDQVRPALEPYLAGNGQAWAFGSPSLTELVGAALHEIPSEAAAAKGELRYEGAARARIDRVAQALVRAGGTPAPRLTVVPVFVRNDSFNPLEPTLQPRFSSVPLFRVVAADGSNRFVDAEGSTYRDLNHWKQANTLPATDVIVPKDGELSGRGKPVELEIFSNQRADNVAWAAAKTTFYSAAALVGGVALVGTGVGAVGGGAARSTVGALARELTEASAPLFTAGSVVASGDGAQQINHLVKTGRPISFSDSDWRSALLTMAASSLSLVNNALHGQTGALVQRLASAETATEQLETIEAGRQFIQQYGQMTPGERLQAAAQIGFFASLAGGSSVKSLNGLLAGASKQGHEAAATSGSKAPSPDLDPTPVPPGFKEHPGLVFKNERAIVNVDGLTSHQRSHYDALLTRFSAEQVDDIIGRVMRSGVDGLVDTPAYLQMSAADLARLSHLMNGIDTAVLLHDVSHAVLTGKDFPYGVNELQENIGNAYANSIIDAPRGVFAPFKIVDDELHVDDAAVLDARAAVDAIVDSGRGIFMNSFHASSENNKRVEGPLRRVLETLDSGTTESRFELFQRGLEENGQIPIDADVTLESKLFDLYREAEQVARTSSDESGIVGQARDITTLLVQAGLEFDAQLPQAEKRRLVIDSVASVIAAHQRFSEVEMPRSGDPRRLSEQWMEPVNGMDKPDYLREYLQIREQVRKALGA